ncbi:Signal recognition particle core component [Arthrobotrys musiformis]|uniref:Signal recognition particle subunit SRP72 n=1 Tax=Arthrobotrys musiformis TaxID=47236 RepID=A0AAV9W3U4_9PEZI
MTTSTPASLSLLLQNLSLDENQSHEEVLRHANNILKSSSDPQTIRTRVVALIKLERYDEAVKSIEQAGSSGLGFEHAYCLYKLGDLKGALEISIDKVETERRQRALKHLHAQAQYRAENFESATAIYEELSALPPLVDNEGYDLRVNLGASEAQLSFVGKDGLRPKKRATAEDLQQYESAFNAACISIARGDLNAGLMLLRTSKKLCSSMEGVSEEDIQTELAPLIAQEIYALIKLGKLEEAAALYKSSDILETSDEAVKLISSANCYLTSQTPNPHVGLRVFEALKSYPQGSQKPFTFQSEILDRNTTILNLQAGKETAAIASAKALKAKNPNDYTISSVVAAIELQTADSSSAKSIAKTLKDAAVGRKLGSTTDIGISLINAQNYLKEDNVTSAVAVIETLLKELENEPEKRWLPGLVGVVAGLYTLQGRKTKAKAELENASAYWRSTTNPDPAVLLATGSAQLNSSNPQDQSMAASIFESLFASNPAPLSNAGYIASHPAEDMPSKIAQLTPLSTLLKDINVNALLDSGVAAPPVKKRPLDAASKPQIKPRKKRKIRLPKGGIDPNKKPDPERWLPLRDRSTYKPKGRKDKKKAKDLTQGGPVTDKDGDTEMIGGNAVTKVAPSQSAASKNKGKKKGGKRK